MLARKANPARVGVYIVDAHSFALASHYTKQTVILWRSAQCLALLRCNARGVELGNALAVAVQYRQRADGLHQCAAQINYTLQNVGQLQFIGQRQAGITQRNQVSLRRSTSRCCHSMLDATQLANSSAPAAIKISSMVAACQDIVSPRTTISTSSTINQNRSGTIYAQPTQRPRINPSIQFHNAVCATITSLSQANREQYLFIPPCTYVSYLSTITKLSVLACARCYRVIPILKSSPKHTTRKKHSR